MRRLPITWGTHNEVLPMGNAFGYTAASVNLREALRRRSDVELVDDGPIVVHVCHPWTYRPQHWPFARNVLLTMYEVFPAPPEFSAAIAQADALLVPCLWVGRLFGTVRLPEGTRRPPILVSPLGFDPKRFPIVEDRVPPRATSRDPFRWLWIGAANERKGHKILLDEWFAFSDVDWMQLYMKTTRHDSDHARARRIVEGNVIYDERMLTRDAMRELYTRANAFVFPSMGEGFGLTALEAAATGLPIVTVNHSGMSDFLRERDGATFVPFQLHTIGTSQGLTARGVRTVPGALGQSMIDVMRNYSAHLRAARKGARRLHREWTWDAAAARLVANLRRLSACGWKQPEGSAPESWAA